MTAALFGAGCCLVAFAAGVRLGWALICLVLGVKKRHWLCAGNGCRLCGDGRVYRSRVAGWMRKGK